MSKKKAARKSRAAKGSKKSVGASVLTIGRKKYSIDEVLLHVGREQLEEETCLTLDLFADSQKNEAGFAINCITFRDATSPDTLQGKAFSLDQDSDDPYNELGESVVVEGDETLELEKLALRFGKIDDTFLDVALKAVCEGDEGSVSVTGKLWAKIVEG
jgi:hypothetical protein